DASASTWNTVNNITATSSDLAALADGTTYQFKVQTVCPAGTSPYSPSQSFTTVAACGTATALTSSGITTTNATVSWNGIAGAVTYNLQCKDASAATWNTVGGITTTSSDLTGLIAGTLYQFQVQTVCSAASGSSSYSDAASFTTAAPCAIPTGLGSINITT